MEYTSKPKLITRILCMLMTLCILAPSAAASAAELIDPKLLYDQLGRSNQAKIYVISEDEVVVLVQSPTDSEQMKNERDMSVTLTTKDTWRTKAHTETIITNSYGMAIFKIDHFRTQEHQQATKYFYGEITVKDTTSQHRQGWHDKDTRLVGGDKKKVILTQNGAEPYVYEAVFNSSDLLMTDYKAQVTPKNDVNHQIKIAVDPGQQNPSSVTFRLMGGDKKLAEQTVSSKTDGRFVANFDQKWLSESGLPVGEAVRVEYTAGSVTKSVKLNLNVEKAKKQEPETNKEEKFPNLGFSIANGDLVVTIPKAIPFIGGYKATLKVPSLPITFYLDTDGKFMLGFTLEYSKEPFSDNEEDKGWKRTNPVKVKDWIQENRKNYQKDKEKIKNQVTPLKGKVGTTPWMPKFKLTFTIGGMFTCMNLYAKSDKNVSVSASTFASIAGDLSVRKYLFAGPVPFFIGGNLKGSIMACYEYQIIINQGDPLKTMRKNGDDTPIDFGPELAISASLGVSVTAGVGFEKFFSIWVEGSVTALPSITIKAETRPDPAKPYPWYVFKLNFSLRAGVRLIFTSYEITPLSYNYVIADNHDPHSKPYFERISGPWAPNPVPGDTGGLTIGVTENTISDAELNEICLGSVTFNAAPAPQPDAHGNYPESPAMPRVYNPGNPAGNYGLDSLSFTLDQSRWDFTVETSAPYENDAMPYDFDYGDTEWTQGTSDGLGIVVPDQRVKILDKGYADPKLKYQSCNGHNFLFFIAVVEVNGVKAPTLVYAELVANNQIKDGKLYPVVFGTETAQNPRYVTDFDVSMALINNEICVETVVAYSKGPSAASSYMGVYTRPFKYTATGPSYLSARKELKTKFAYHYKALMPQILLTQNTQYYDDADDHNQARTTYQVCLAYLLQYDIAYKDYASSTPSVVMYARFQSRNWDDYNVVTPAFFNAPISQIFIGKARDLYRDHSIIYKFVDTWRVAYVYNDEGKFDKPENDKIQNYYYYTDQRDGYENKTYYLQGTELKGHDVQQVHDMCIAFIGSDDKLNISTHSRYDTTYASSIELPHEGKSLYYTQKLNVWDSNLNYFYYWPEEIKVHSGTPAPYPLPAKQYRNLMGRYVSVGLHYNVNTSAYEFRDNPRFSESFILCKLDNNIDYLRAYPMGDGYCGLYYTSCDNLLAFSADINFARVPIVDAAEVASMAPNDPCIAQGEVFCMYANIQNSGNTFLGSGRIQMNYKTANHQSNQTKTVDFLDCNKIMPTMNEFDFTELTGEDAYYRLVDDITLADAMKDPDTSRYFDAIEYADSSDQGYQQGQVRLKSYAPGVTHLYRIDGLQIPKEAKGWVEIESKMWGFTRKGVWDSAYQNQGGAPAMTDAEANGGMMYKALGDGDYTAVTNGADIKVGYSDVSIEGQLLRIEDETYLELNLRNESSNPSNVLLKIYGDSTLLLEREFANIASGALPKVDNQGMASSDGALEEYFNGTPTEGATGNENGYISLTLPVSALTQGRQFYKLTCVLDTPAGLYIEGDERDSVELVLMHSGALTFTSEPDELYANLGEDAGMSASFKGGIKPYSVKWQKAGEEGDWFDVNPAFVKTGAEASARGVLERLFASASADTEETQSTLMFYNIKQTDAGEYRCVVTDKSGYWVATDWTKLNVTGPAPVTGDRTPIGLMILVLGLSLCGIAALVITHRRRRAGTR